MWNLLLIGLTAVTQLSEMVSFAALRAGWSIFGAVGYALTALLFKVAMAAPGGGLAVANGLWNAFSNVGGLLVGTLLFGEVLGLSKIVGLVLGSLSAVLLTMS